MAWLDGRFDGMFDRMFDRNFDGMLDGMFDKMFDGMRQLGCHKWTIENEPGPTTPPP